MKAILFGVLAVLLSVTPAFALDVQRSAGAWVDAVPILADTPQHVVVYSVGGMVPPGAVVVLTAQAEVTNPYKSLVGVGSYLMRGNGDDWTGIVPVTPPAMTNVTPDRHHEIIRMTAVDTPPPGYWAYYVVLYAASSTLAGRDLTVELGYGGLTMMVLP